MKNPADSSYSIAPLAGVAVLCFILTLLSAIIALFAGGSFITISTAVGGVLAGPFAGYLFFARDQWDIGLHACVIITSLLCVICWFGALKKSGRLSSVFGALLVVAWFAEGVFFVAASST